MSQEKKNPYVYDYKQVYRDLKHLEEYGSWELTIPRWAKDKAKEFSTFSAGPAVILWGYQFIADSLMEKEMKADKDFMESLRCKHCGQFH